MAATGAAAGSVSYEADRRQRAYALLDAAIPGSSRAVRCCRMALEMHQADRHMRNARSLLRDALVCGLHRPTIYRAWITMEEREGSDAAGVRELFEGWRIWYGLDSEGRGGEDEGAFWCRYIAFELRHGNAASVRAVAERAVAACPRVPAVHAKYAKAELRLGHPDRASDVLQRARHVFAADADARTREMLMDEVTRYKNSLHEGNWLRFRSLFPFGRRWSRPAGGYEPIGLA